MVTLPPSPQSNEEDDVEEVIIEGGDDDEGEDEEEEDSEESMEGEDDSDGGRMTESDSEMTDSNGGVTDSESTGKVAEGNSGSGGGALMLWSEEKEEAILKKYPHLVSEFTKFFADKTVWHEAFDILGPEKLKEMNEKWLLQRIQEVELMAREAQLLHKHSKLMREAIKSRSKRN